MIRIVVMATIDFSLIQHGYQSRVMVVGYRADTSQCVIDGSSIKYQKAPELSLVSLMC